MQMLAKQVTQQYHENKDFFADIKKARLPHEQFINDPTMFEDPKRFIEFYCSSIMSGIGKINPPEAMYLIELCKATLPKLIVEIGIFTGGSTKLLAMFTKFHGGKLVSIDGKLNPGVPKQIEQLGCKDQVTLLEYWTPWLPFSIKDWEIDFLYIDGDHSRIGVIADFHYFNRYLNQGGIVVFHDYHLLAVRNAIEVLQESFNLEEVGQVFRMKAFKKLDPRDEVYLQVTHGKENMIRGF